MLHLATICSLLGAVVAQSGYEYNKPGQPFIQGTTANQPGYSPGSPGAFPGTTPSFPGAPQGTDYSNPGAGPAPGFSGPSGYPAASNQQYPDSRGPTQPGYTGQGPTQGQQTIPQATSGFSAPNYQEQGQDYPGNIGQPGLPSGQGGTTGFGPAGPSSGAEDNGAYEGGDYSAIPGEPERDYPIFTEIPQTSFRCDAQAYPGYYADVEARCQVFHVCSNNRTFDFLCPNGTIFSQQVFVCVWWNQFDCNSAPSFYNLNANLYDYSKTGSSSQAGYPAGNAGQNTYAGPSGPQGPISTFPGAANGDQGSSSGYPSTPGAVAGFPGPAGSSYQGSTGSQASSTYTTPGQGQASYPGISGPTGYPGNVQQGPSYSGGPGYPGPTASQSYLGSRDPAGFPGSDNQGYPSGKPSGPAFGGGRPISETGYPQQPNREYLPPRN